MDHIKDDGYYQGEITPIGPGLDYEQPHDRDRLPTADGTRAKPRESWWHHPPRHVAATAEAEC